MATKIFPFVALLLALTSCECKDEDPFGLRPIVQVPIISTPDQTAFTIGDTIWWEGDFSNMLSVEGVSVPIELRGFNFLAEFDIQRIDSLNTSGTPPIKMVSEIGDIILSGEQEGAFFYDVEMVENEESYQFKFGIVLNEVGVFNCAVYTIGIRFDRVNHPALFVCGNRRREAFDIYYLNPSTSKSVYDSLVVPTISEEVFPTASFERYANAGSIAFTVTE